MAEKADGLRDHLKDAVPEWFHKAETEGKPTTKSDAVKSVKTLASVLEVEGQEAFVRHPSEADVPAEAVEVVVHMGCHSVKTPVIIESTMDIVEELGYTAVALGGYNNCCGIEDMKRGNIDTAEALDSNRFRNIEAFDPDFAIAECSSCHAVTETASMGYRTPGFEFPFMIEFLNDRLEAFKEKIQVTDPVTVTFHDHYDYRGWMPDEQSDYVRELFSSLPGVEVVEMEHTKGNRLPCELAITDDQHPYDNINDQIYCEAEAAGADVLISIWHGCHRCLLAKEQDHSVTTKNYATFLAERLGLEYRDKNREYTEAARSGDIDCIVEDARPIFEQNSLTEPEARQIIETRYPQTY